MSQAPIIILLGEDDTDPNKPFPEMWRDTPLARVQGPHRLARGIAFFEAGKAAAEKLNIPFRWDLKTVPGVGHNGLVFCKITLLMFYDPIRMNAFGKGVSIGNALNLFTEEEAI